MGRHGVKFATVREAAQYDGPHEYIEWHIECRFENGDKYAAITVDEEHEELADAIAAWLSERTPDTGEGSDSDGA